ncbi:MAG TPA: ABC transporter permease [Vicinamibacterales bacterium]|nr:ABC transporter permease [Vicinamibacterales bacterium]
MLDDLRTAVRSLRLSSGFTAIALTVLALGIGSATAIFSVVDAIVLRGLPFDEHDRLGVIYEVDTRHATTFGLGNITPQTYLDWRGLQQPFQQLTAVAGTRLRLKTEGAEPADARAQRVTPEFFPVLRVAPMLGRTFNPNDEVDGHDHVAILSYGFWQSRFGGSPDAIGKTIELSEAPYEIVGVMPASFSYPVGSDRPSDLLVPMTFAGADRVKGDTHNYNYTVIGRLKDGVSFKQASDEMWRLSEQLDKKDPKWAPGRRAYVITLHEHLVGKVRGWMLMLLGAVVLVLAIACTNVANLMLVRATSRTREMSIRAALGAGPWRLVRGLLVEGLVLSLSGAAIGVLFALGGVNALRTWLPAGLPRVAAIGIDLRVLGAAVGAAVVTGIVFGLVPAVHSSRPDLTGSLKEGGRSSTAGNTAQRVRSILVVTEMALAVVLLVGAGLFTGSFVKLLQVDPGFDYHNVLALDVGLRLMPGHKYDKQFAAEDARYAARVLESVRSVPGVVSAGEVSGGLPLTGSWSRTDVELPGRGELKGENDEIDVRNVTPGYLELLRIPLRRGRTIAATDRENTPPVLVINETAARKYWPGRDPIGQHVKLEQKDFEVVGVVADIHHLGPEMPPRQECYMPLAQSVVFGVTVVARTSGRPLAVLPAMKSAIWRINPEQRLTSDTVTLDSYMDRLIAQRRFNMAVLALFGMLGLMIAAVGIYGVMAYIVAQRTSEIGVRMALGATRGRVMGMVLGRAVLLMVSGIAIGGAAAWYFSAGVRTFLFDVQPTDKTIFAMALGTLLAAGLIASAIPALRAAAVDPLVALRHE